MIIKQEIYWNLDDDNKVVIDKEEIEREFRIKLESIIEEKTGCEEREMDEYMKLHDIRKQGIYNRIITASNFVIGDNGTKESKEILKTFIELVKLTEEEYEEQKKLYG